METTPKRGKFICERFYEANHLVDDILFSVVKKHVKHVKSKEHTSLAKHLVRYDIISS